MMPAVYISLTRRRVIFFLILAIIGISAKGTDKISITISNPLDKKRTDEPVTIERFFLEKKMGKIPADKIILIEQPDGEKIASQTDDINNDGKWDELAFLINIGPNEKARLIVKIIDRKDNPVFQQRAHARLSVSRMRNNQYVEINEEERPKDHLPQSMPMLYPFEGPGWENDKIAFRSYFDSRNGKDIFGKLTTAMVLDSVGQNPDISYHVLAGWGMDVLKVGNSLGAGALAVKCDTALYRLGQTLSAHYKLISDGPVRAIFRLDYNGWVVNKDTLNVQDEITIWGGKNYYISKVKLTGKSNKIYNLVTGISMVHLVNENYKPEFESADKNYSFLAVNEALSENNDLLSMGILVNKKYLEGWNQSPDTGAIDQIVKTACVIFDAPMKSIVEYRFFAGWERADERFKTEKLLNKLMTDEAEKLSDPIILSY